MGSLPVLAHILSDLDDDAGLVVTGSAPTRPGELPLFISRSGQTVRPTRYQGLSWRFLFFSSQAAIEEGDPTIDLEKLGAVRPEELLERVSRMEGRAQRRSRSARGAEAMRTIQNLKQSWGLERIVGNDVQLFDASARRWRPGASIVFGWGLDQLCFFLLVPLFVSSEVGEQGGGRRRLRRGRHRGEAPPLP